MSKTTSNHPDCKTCERPIGIPLFLLRKTVVSKRVTTNVSSWSKVSQEPKNLVSEIKYQVAEFINNVFQVPVQDSFIPSLEGREPSESLTSFEYALRTLRDGYVYVMSAFEKSTGIKERKIECYEVLPEGQGYRLRNAADVIDTNIQPMSPQCITKFHNTKASFIYVDKLRVKKVWIAYSSRPWPLSAIEHYKKAPENELARFTAVDITPTFRQNPTTNPRAINMYDVLGEKGDNPFKRKIKVMEFVLKSESELGFKSAHTFYSKVNMIESLRSHISTYKRMYDTEPAAIVLEDTFGIVEELNFQRIIHCHSQFGTEKAYSKIENSQNMPLTLASMNKFYHQQGLNKLSSYINPKMRQLKYFKDDRLIKRITRELINKEQERIPVIAKAVCTATVSTMNGEIPISEDTYNTYGNIISAEGTLTTKAENEEKYIRTEWNKLNKLLDQKKLKQFDAEEQNRSELLEVSQYFSTYSKDYYFYCRWLFGDKKYISKLTHHAPRSFNQTPFWAIEFDLSTPARQCLHHNDLLKMLDGDCTQFVKLNDYLAFWDELQANPESIFYILSYGNHKGIPLNDISFYDYHAQKKVNAQQLIDTSALLNGLSHLKSIVGLAIDKQHADTTDNLKNDTKALEAEQTRLNTELAQKQAALDVKKVEVESLGKQHQALQTKRDQQAGILNATDAAKAENTQHAYLQALEEQTRLQKDLNQCKSEINRVSQQQTMRQSQYNDLLGQQYQKQNESGKVSEQMQNRQGAIDKTGRDIDKLQNQLNQQTESYRALTLYEHKLDEIAAKTGADIGQAEKQLRSDVRQIHKMTRLTTYGVTSVTLSMSIYQKEFDRFAYAIAKTDGYVLSDNSLNLLSDSEQKLVNQQKNQIKSGLHPQLSALDGSFKMKFMLFVRTPELADDLANLVKTQSLIKFEDFFDLIKKHIAEFEKEAASLQLDIKKTDHALNKTESVDERLKSQQQDDQKRIEQLNEEIEQSKNKQQVLNTELQELNNQQTKNKARLDALDKEVDVNSKTVAVERALLVGNIAVLEKQLTEQQAKIAVAKREQTAKEQAIKALEAQQKAISQSIVNNKIVLTEAESRQAKNALKINGIIYGFMMVLQGKSLHDNWVKLSGLLSPQEAKTVRRGIITDIANLIIMPADLVVQYKYFQAKQLAASMAKAGTSMSSESLIKFGGKWSKLSAYGFGSLLASFTIYDAWQESASGIKLFGTDEEEYGSIRIIGSGLLMVSAILLIIPGLGWFVAGIIFLLMGTGLISASKELDQWTAMQRWFSLCYFSGTSYKRFGEKYTLDELGLGRALNDYFNAQSGTNANITFTGGLPFPRWLYYFSANADVISPTEALNEAARQKELDIEDNKRDIYLSLMLPQFNAEKAISRFRCQVELSSQNGEKVEFEYRGGYPRSQNAEDQIINHNQQQSTAYQLVTKLLGESPDLNQLQANQNIIYFTQSATQASKLVDLFKYQTLYIDTQDKKSLNKYKLHSINGGNITQLEITQKIAHCSDFIKLSDYKILMFYYSNTQNAGNVPAVFYLEGKINND